MLKFKQNEIYSIMIKEFKTRTGAILVIPRIVLSICMLATMERRLTSRQTFLA